MLLIKIDATEHSSSSVLYQKFSMVLKIEMNFRDQVYDVNHKNNNH